MVIIIWEDQSSINFTTLDVVVEGPCISKDRLALSILEGGSPDLGSSMVGDEPLFLLSIIISELLIGPLLLGWRSVLSLLLHK